MWSVRILNGPHAGQIFSLKTGSNIVGRSAQANVQILQQGISKNHCDIQVFKDKIVINDLGSSNGTFLNGVKVQNAIVRLGEKFSLHNVLMDIVPSVEMNLRAVQRSMPQPHQVPGPLQQHPHLQQQGAPSAPAFDAGHATPLEQPLAVEPQPSKIKSYIDNVVLPGVYKLAQYFEFRWVLAGFVGFYIFTVTALSMIPMVQISKSSILQESKRRALTLSQQIANNNKKTLAENRLTELSLFSADAEEGVSQALIVQDNGMILSPSEKAGRNSNLPFVSQARKERREFTAEIDSTTIGAASPITLYDPNANEMVVKAYAIIVYDVSSVSFDQGKMISLFMQTLMIASLAGLILFFFLYKLIEFPVLNLSQQLDLALRDKHSDLQITFQFDAVQKLVSNMNSILTRYFQGQNEQSGSGVAASGSLDTDADNLVKMIGGPGLVLTADKKVLAVNHYFEQICRINFDILKTGGLGSLPDLALQQNIDHLIDQAKQNIYVIHTDQLEFSGIPCKIQCQAISANGGIGMFFITILPVDGQQQGGHAA